MDKIATAQTSAKIYQFPAGGRDGLAVRSRVATNEIPPVSATKDGLPILSETAWYHDAEMRDAAPPRKR